MSLPKAAALCLLVATVLSCGPPVAKSPAQAAGPRFEEVRQVEGRPPVALLARDGDPSAAMSVAVLTSGIDASHGAEVPVALAGIVQARLAAAGLRDLGVEPGAEGFRVRALVPSQAGARDLAAAVRDALTKPIAAEGPDVDAAQRKLAALARLPLPDPALLVAARCTGEPFAARSAGSPPPGPPGPPELEAWRAASLGLGRVVLGAVGPREVVEALASAVAQGPVWPVAAPVQPAAPPPTAQPIQIYDASPDLPAGAARLSVIVSTADASRAVAATAALGSPRGRLAEHLATLARPATLREVTSTVHPGWGCLRLTVDLPPPAGIADPPVDLATAVDVARRLALAEIDEAPSSAATPREVANRAGDPREAADRLAYWALMSLTPAAARGEAPSVSTVVGLGVAHGPGSDAALGDRAASLSAEIDRAEGAQNEPVAEIRVRPEIGQSGVWLLLASPCGTSVETSLDAGASAMAALTVTERARREALPADTVEAWIAADGIGVVLHAFRAPGESAAALSRRVADTAARSFASATLDPRDIVGARTLLLSRRPADEVRAFTVLGEALAPGHPSWIFPSGTSEAIERSSNELVNARLDALRSGPLRVAEMGDADAARGQLVADALTQWLPARGAARRTCPATSPATPRPGTYAVEVPGASASAWLAIPLPSADAAAIDTAALVAAGLGARGGLLERALGAGLARSWGARVLGLPRAPALVVTVSSAQGSLDAAVAEVRVLFDRLRQDGLTDADLRLAVASMEEGQLEASLDPKARLIALWRGDAAPRPKPAPGADAVRAFAAATLKDDALVIVAARPPRATAR